MNMLNWSEREREAIDRLATELDVSKPQVMRKAIRLLQLIHERAKQGEEMRFVRNGVIVQDAVGLPAVE